MLAWKRGWREENQEKDWKMAGCCLVAAPHWIVAAAVVARVELNNNIKIKKQQQVHGEDN